MSISVIGHIGICVSEMQRSLRFWQGALGFKVVQQSSFRGSSWKRVLELDDLELHTAIIRRDRVTLELLAFAKPGYVGSAERRPMNQLGFTHLAIWVNDLDAVAKSVIEHGGFLVEETRTIFDQPQIKAKWLMATDPDGTRLELIQYPEGENALARD